MSLEDIIADYITQQRSLGKRYTSEAITLRAFRRSVGDVPVRDIRPEMISRFVDRGATSHETRSKKYRALAGLFFFAVSRRLLKTSPMPRRRKCVYPTFVPYIYSEAELKRLLAAIPVATEGARLVIDADTLRTFLLLLYGAGLRRGEAMRLKIEDVDLEQSLIHVRQTKFFKTRLVPLSDSLTAVMRAFIARPGAVMVRLCAAKRSASHFVASVRSQIFEEMVVPATNRACTTSGTLRLFIVSPRGIAAAPT